MKINRQRTGGHGANVPLPTYEVQIFRHCERSEAIHRTAKQEWIASSLRSSQ
jgi:hypothetical protein